MFIGVGVEEKDEQNSKGSGERAVGDARHAATRIRGKSQLNIKFSECLIHASTTVNICLCQQVQCRLTRTSYSRQDIW